MLVTSKELVLKAQKGGYAVAAINTQGGSYDLVRAIVEAAEEARSPIMLAVYAANMEYFGMEWGSKVVTHFAKKASVPVAVHLDHSSTFDTCVQAIVNGFSSVMIDGSTKSLKENVALTNEVIKVARAAGVSVEAEVGELVRLDAGGESMPNENLANVADVKEFLAGCSPDMLAIGIGNAHGFYKGEPNIRLDILEQVRGATDVPLVLHGATGIPEKTVKKAIQLGITKINFGTLVRHRYMEYVKEGMETLDHKGHSWKVSRFAESKLKGVIHGIIDFCESGGKANA